MEKIRRISNRFQKDQKEINSLLSDIEKCKDAFKDYASAQTSVSQSLLKWAAAGENEAIQDVVRCMESLNDMCIDVHKDFTNKLREFHQCFAIIKEEERKLIEKHQTLRNKEEKKVKAHKALRKATEKYGRSPPDMVQLENQVISSEAELARVSEEVTRDFKEQEAIKMITLKDKLRRISEAKIVLSEKTYLIHQTQLNIISELPDVCDKRIEDLRYSGHGVNRQRVQDLKDSLHRNRMIQPRNSAPCLRDERVANPPVYSSEPHQNSYNHELAYRGHPPLSRASSQTACCTHDHQRKYVRLYPQLD